jgi:hypothetical protein
MPASRTRRRTVLWLIVGLLLLAPPAIRMLRSAQTSDYLPRQFTGAPGEDIGRIVREGPVEVIVLDARRLASGEAGLHLVITADGLAATEELVAQPGLSGFIEVYPTSGPGEPPPLPPQMITVGKGTALEAWLALAPGIQRVSFDVAALFASRVSGPVPPPLSAHGPPPPPPINSRGLVPPSPPPPPLIPPGLALPTEGRSCAVPLNEFDQCGLFADEGRHLATIRLDMSSLGVPAWIWRSPAD